MSEMIDRVAQAIFDVAPFRENCGPFSEQSAEYQRLTKVYAKAAIYAMREPTAAMTNAGDESTGSSGLAVVHWETMIDAALSPTDSAAS